jgi:hypothetical protein
MVRLKAGQLAENWAGMLGYLMAAMMVVELVEHLAVKWVVWKVV